MARPIPPSPSLPRFDQLLVPTVKALRSLGGSAGIQELTTKIAEQMALTEEALAFRREKASMNEVPYRAAWARTYLRMDDVVQITTRGVWALTPRGRDISDEELASLPMRVRNQRVRDRQSPSGDEIEAVREVDIEQDWRGELLSVLRELPPAAFERVSQRILRESGFVKVEVTGRSGDGGIDGVGVLRVQLISFQVLFQCKRYRETVGAAAIRDFRGAMVGRTDKGLFITTGRFTSEASREAT